MYCEQYCNIIFLKEIFLLIQDFFRIFVEYMEKAYLIRILFCVLESEFYKAYELGSHVNNVTNRGDDRGTALHLAAQEGNIECVHHLLRAGAKADLETIHGDTPLALAAEHGKGFTANSGSETVLETLHLQLHWNARYETQNRQEAAE